jgi:hypothetical protein
MMKPQGAQATKRIGLSSYVEGLDKTTLMAEASMRWSWTDASHPMVGSLPSWSSLESCIHVLLSTSLVM